MVDWAAYARSPSKVMKKPDWGKEREFYEEIIDGRGRPVSPATVPIAGVRQSTDTRRVIISRAGSKLEQKAGLVVTLRLSTIRPNTLILLNRRQRISWI